MYLIFKIVYHGYRVNATCSAICYRLAKNTYLLCRNKNILSKIAGFLRHMEFEAHVARFKRTGAGSLLNQG